MGRELWPDPDYNLDPSEFGPEPPDEGDYSGLDMHWDERISRDGWPFEFDGDRYEPADEEEHP